MHQLLLCINQHTTFEVPSFTDFVDLPCMHQLLLCINQHTTFEVPSFTDFVDFIGGEI